MKRITLIVLMAFFGATASWAQGTLGKGGTQLNAGFGFSGFGVPVYLGLDFGVHEDITIGPKVSYRNYRQRFGGTRYSQSLTVIGFNGNYHFNRLLQLPDQWDLYAGLTLAYYIWSSADFPTAEASGIGLEAQIGGRYFFAENFGINLEFGGGSISGGGIGITYIF